MDFFELKVFLVLSRTLHFAKAAQEVNLSPSALSRMISRLEEECGVKLFERDNREVTLTENGRRFVRFAQQCLESKTELMDDFLADDDIVRGTLRVYASVTACYTIMPPFVKRFSSRYPGIVLSVETGDPAAALSMVYEDRADVAVAAIPQTPSDFFECFSVTQSPLVFAASSMGLYTHVDGSPQDIVSSVPLILPKAGLARERFDAWAKSRNVKPRIAAQAEGNEAVMALTALGLGIGLVPRIVVENGPYSREGFICHSAGNSMGYYDIGFIQRKKIKGSEAQRCIQNAAREVLKEFRSSSDMASRD